MLGAIIGDIVGSRFEFNNTNKIDFELFTPECSYTDDTICTIAIANALTEGDKDYKGWLLSWCNMYRFPMGGYGGSFARWIASDDPQPYNSFGNGSAMRVAPIAWWFDTLEEVQAEAEKTALPTHNHPEGIKGAVATATAIFLARKHGKKDMLMAMTEYYPQWVEPLLGQNRFDETCQGTMPVVFGIINKANSFEEAIRYAIAVGGDSDTIGAIVGSIAEAIWGIPENIHKKALEYLPGTMDVVIGDFFRCLVDRLKVRDILTSKR
ncbi:MAG: ADP-ribosylglycohydrolase family protein [Rikenellaceae bacterium]|nr:ADP-ribosylglycohydrolase family protein [Rikenellaceae bacterium]